VQSKQPSNPCLTPEGYYQTANSMYHYAQVTKIQMQAMKEHVQVGLGYDCDEAKTDIHESNSHKRCAPKPLPPSQRPSHPT
jgi:hypothetical protein